MSAKKPDEIHIPLPRGWTHVVKLAVLHVVALAEHARKALVEQEWKRAHDPAARALAELELAKTEILRLNEELRIKDNRMKKLPAKKRPYYEPVDRLAILQLAAARGWSGAQTARRFLLTQKRIGHWKRRARTEGEDSLLSTHVPVNRYPDFVVELVQRLAVLVPSLSDARSAKALARAGLHLATSTVRRMKRQKRPPPAKKAPLLGKKKIDAAKPKGRPVVAKRRDHVWSTDLTLVSPLGGGLAVPWWPFSSSPRWPFCWIVAAVIDVYSRRVLGITAFMSTPSAEEVQAFLDETIASAKTKPKYLVTDLGPQFLNDDHESWCKSHGIKPRYCSKEHHRANARIERFWRTLKTEALRSTIATVFPNRFLRVIEPYAAWYNEERPHLSLGGCTPNEIYEGRKPKNTEPRFEPRSLWPKAARCAAPQAPPSGEPGAKLELSVRFLDESRAHPIVELRRAA